MSYQTEGGTAFPAQTDDRWFYGMSLRDYFAAAALHGADVPMNWTHTTTAEDDVSRQRIAQECYALADAMLAQREKE